VHTQEFDADGVQITRNDATLSLKSHILGFLELQRLLYIATRQSQQTSLRMRVPYPGIQSASWYDATLDVG
jgi:hypothetical protein